VIYWPQQQPEGLAEKARPKLASRARWQVQLLQRLVRERHLWLLLRQFWLQLRQFSIS